MDFSAIGTCFSCDAFYSSKCNQNFYLVCHLSICLFLINIRYSLFVVRCHCHNKLLGTLQTIRLIRSKRMPKLRKKKTIFVHFSHFKYFLYRWQWRMPIETVIHIASVASVQLLIFRASFWIEHNVFIFRKEQYLTGNQIHYFVWTLFLEKVSHFDPDRSLMNAERPNIVIISLID